MKFLLYGICLSYMNVANVSKCVVVVLQFTEETGFKKLLVCGPLTSLVSGAWRADIKSSVTVLKVL